MSRCPDCNSNNMPCDCDIKAEYPARIEELEHVIERINHAAANAQEWFNTDPNDCDQLDRDNQVDAWFEQIFDAIKSSKSVAFRQEAGEK